MKDIAVSIRVTGRVQGVFFRAWTQEQAQRLGLSGWVRNKADGSVAVLVAGPEARVQELIAGLHRGPPDAVVRDVSTAPAEAPHEKGFVVRP